jgi:HEAT repeat protein
MVAVVADAKRHDLARAACAWALGVRKAKAAIPALTAALTDNRGEAQRLAAWALAQIGDKKALPDVIRAYFTRDDAARPVLGWALAHLAGAAPAAASAPDLADYPMRNGKFHGATALARLPGELPASGDASAAVIGHEAAIAEGIRAVLGEHRDMVLGMLVDLDGRAGGITLGSLIPADAKLDGKSEKALAAIGDAIAKDVAAHLKDRDPKVRAVALSVAAKIDAGGGTIDDAVVAALGDDASQVRQAAMRAVVTVARKRGEVPAGLRTALAGAIDDGEWQDRRVAARALGDLGGRASGAVLDAIVDGLIPGLGDDSAYVRETSADALAPLGSRRATQALIAASRDEVWEVRRAAAAALLAGGDPAAKARLAELAADDERDEVRAAAGARP